MFLFLGIASLVIFLILISSIIVSQEECKDAIAIAFFGALSIFFLITGIILIGEYCSPTIAPIDVYRGRTTLEITYKDSIAIDSVVVWKDVK